MPDPANDIDVYGILGIELGATTEEVRKAYKKKALKHHPDKNPNDKYAAAQFLLLTRALEILLNKEAREAYDAILKAKQAAALRHKALDANRKKLKEDLEAREKIAAQSSNVVSDEVFWEEKLKRLQKEGAEMVQEEIRRLEEELLRDLNKPERVPTQCQIKASWSKADDAYTEQSLTKVFSKYGDIVAVAVLKNKAIIEFEDSNAAALAVRVETGFVSNPLTVTYANSKRR